jgi:hypothetical protein
LVIKVVPVVEPSSEAPTATAGGAVTALAASVLGAVEVMSTLRYWGVEDKLSLELLRYLLESEELSPFSVAMPIARSNTYTDLDADHAATHAAQSASMVLLAGEPRVGDMFGFVLDLQRLRGMSAVQRLVAQGTCLCYVPCIQCWGNHN